MGNAQVIASVLAPVYLMLGLSILLYAKQWKKLYAKWADGHFDLFGLMFMTTVLGLLVIHYYNVWEWNIWLIVTVSGWGMFLKGLFYFLAPEKTIKGVMKMAQSSNMIYLGGVVALFFGLFLGYYTYLM